ncbi:MAG: LacI family DNA-binding transcriptional regulator [Actinobacteria bacterium]|nr:LacI family DNA-binding transcriptional regulator [Actinomycetota bacterium]
MAASMKDVAARASVSLGTVSNVLNHPDLVATSTRLRVEEAIRDLGFIPSAAAQQLRAGRAKVLGLVVPDIANPYFMEVARGVEDAALESGYVVILCNSDEQAEREDRYLAVLESQRVGGILIAPVRKSLKPLSRLLQHGVAVTLLGNAAISHDVCSASVDDTLGGGLAAEHAIELGHTRLVWLAGPRDIPRVSDREAGLMKAARSAKVHVTRIAAAQMTTAAGDTAMDSALANGLDATALLCANDLLALGAIRALNRAGLKVPDDVSVIGYDDIEFAASAAVPLTSVRQPKYELGYAAAKLVIGECEDPATHAHQRVQFQPQLIVRASTAPSRPRTR